MSTATSNNASSTTSTANTIRLWDLPLRIFHWSLVVAVIGAIITAKIGADLIDLHAKLGYTIIGLLAFRISWGFIGSTYSRFLHFIPTPSRVRSYLKGNWKGVGHNPLGAFSVFALLGLLVAQVTTGLFANDDITFTGPLFDLISKETSDRITGIHELLSNLLLGLLGLHVAAIIFYVYVKKDNLVKPMITGKKEVLSGESTSKGGIFAFIIAVSIAVAVVYSAINGSHFFKAETPPAPPANSQSAPSW